MRPTLTGGKRSNNAKNRPKNRSISHLVGAFLNLYFRTHWLYAFHTLTMVEVQKTALQYVPVSLLATMGQTDRQTDRQTEIRLIYYRLRASRYVALYQRRSAASRLRSSKIIKTSGAWWEKKIGCLVGKYNIESESSLNFAPVTKVNNWLLGTPTQTG